MSSSSARRIGAALVASASLVGASVHAQPADPARPAAPGPDARGDAKKVAERAQAHFDLGEYEEAIADFKEAYRLFPNPGLLYNLGQAHRLKGDCGGALQMYRNYLRLAPETPHRQVVEKHIVDMEACEKTRKEPAIPPTLSPSETSAPVEAAPPRPPPPPPSKRPQRLRLAGMISGGVGVVAVAAGAYFAYDAARSEDKLIARLDDPGVAWTDLEDLDSRGKRSELLGATLLATGGAAIAAGATLYVLGWRSERAPTLSLAPMPGGAHAALAWGF